MVKVTLQHIDNGPDEIIIRCREMTEEIDALLQIIRHRPDRIIARDGERQMLINPDDVLYLESVDDNVCVCTADQVARTSLTLAAAENTYSHIGFFRCSKSMVVNIYHIGYLRSVPGGRVDVTMDNGEHVIISRRYVKGLRSVLKGEYQ